jgi:hypothetical protein
MPPARSKILVTQYPEIPAGKRQRFVSGERAISNQHLAASGRENTPKNRYPFISAAGTPIWLAGPLQRLNFMAEPKLNPTAHPAQGGSGMTCATNLAQKLRSDPMK